MGFDATHPRANGQPQLAEVKDGQAQKLSRSLRSHQLRQSPFAQQRMVDAETSITQLAAPIKWQRLSVDGIDGIRAISAVAAVEGMEHALVDPARRDESRPR